MVDADVVDFFDNLLLGKTIAVNCGYNWNEDEQTNDDANRTTCDHFVFTCTERIPSVDAKYNI